MRFSTVQTSFDTATALTQGRTNVIDLVYRGSTVGNTPTEVLIDGIPGKRLVPDRNSVVQLVVQAVQLHATGTARTSMMYVTATCNSAGVITIQNNTSVIFGAGATPAALTSPLGVNVSADNGILFDVVAASGNTPAYIRLQVRGEAGITASWEVAVRALEVTNLNN